jgi:hypothetical protein
MLNFLQNPKTVKLTSSLTLKNEVHKAQLFAKSKENKIHFLTSPVLLFVYIFLDALMCRACF